MVHKAVKRTSHTW